MHCLLWTFQRPHIVAALALVLAVADPLPKRAGAETPPAKELTNSLGMKFTAIPAGEFLMGALPAEITERKDQLIKRGGEDDNGDEIHKEEIAVVESEGPQHQVTISNPFLLGT